MAVIPVLLILVTVAIIFNSNDNSSAVEEDWTNIAELSEEASKTAEKILRANLKPLEELAEELLKKESLDEKELEPILKNVRMPA